MRNIRNQYNYEQTEASFEVSSPEILTIQGDTFTIRELVSKMNQGLVPQIRPSYNNDDEEGNYDAIDYESINRLDLVEKAEIKAEIDQRVTILQQQQENEKKQAQNKQKEAELEALKQQIKNELSNPQKPNDNV